ncbi:hypothetical protein IAT38_000067 [Cryptococcus sp. DSM 104549]
MTGGAQWNVSPPLTADLLPADDIMRDADIDEIQDLAAPPSHYQDRSAAPASPTLSSTSTALSSPTIPHQHPSPTLPDAESMQRHNAEDVEGVAGDRSESEDDTSSSAGQRSESPQPPAEGNNHSSPPTPALQPTHVDESNLPEGPPPYASTEGIIVSPSLLEHDWQDARVFDSAAWNEGRRGGGGAGQGGRVWLVRERDMLDQVVNSLRSVLREEGAPKKKATGGEWTDTWEFHFILLVVGLTPVYMAIMGFNCGNRFSRNWRMATNPDDFSIRGMARGFSELIATFHHCVSLVALIAVLAALLELPTLPVLAKIMAARAAATG